MDQKIVIRGAREHNLKHIDLDIPRNRLVVVTGISGSGKSSLAFDTIYAEGQRRYMESLSAYARQFIGMMERPGIDFIDGLSPVIAIDQKTVSNNPRSTVGTVTEVYDFLRLLYARAGKAYSYISGKPMRKQSDDEIIDTISQFEERTKLMILAPVVRGRKGHYRELFEDLSRQGYERVRVDGEIRMIEEGMKLDRYSRHDIEVVVDRLITKEGIRPRVARSVEVALDIGGGTLIAHVVDGPEEVERGDHLFSRHLTSPEDGISYDDPSPHTFSFNSPYGACERCDGLGTQFVIDPELVIPEAHRSIDDGAIVALDTKRDRDRSFMAQLRAVADRYDIDLDVPYEELSREEQKIIFEGAGEEQFEASYTYKGRTLSFERPFEGLREHIRYGLEDSASASQKDWARSYMRKMPCPECDGGRLNEISLSYKIGGKTIAELASMDLPSLRDFFDEVELEERQQVIGRPIIKEIKSRLEFLLEVGLDYLSLDRPARSLSGGESQRIRLATQIGKQLVGVLYVLDEPTIGLHPRDNQRLISSLQQLRDQGNTVIVVEHDREMIESADYVIDLGPGAGVHGGHVVGAAPPDQLPERSNGHESVTAAYLNEEKEIEVPGSRREGSGKRLVLRGARGHNLKQDPLEIPLGTFVCVTGVSGSGKSSLIDQTLYPVLARSFHNAHTVPLPYDRVEGMEHVDKVIDIDQSPIGRTPRSNPATYTNVFTGIRKLFARLPEAQIRGYDKGRFSFNTKGGRCEDCSGAGIKKMEMDFLPDVYVECETCKGKRYNPETLEILYKGKNIADVLDMTVSEAREFFDSLPRIERKLDTLESVGLGYIHLGQQSTTLSGGEAQRVKLSKELSRPGTGSTVYILDEPTTGLHFEDIRHLLTVLQQLVDQGNTVIVIEHNLDVVKCADHIIDLGPEGGDPGGYIVATGSPEEVAMTETHTGRFLKEELERTTASVGSSV
jgi:excinuclease ABC subunit A